jgi:hypothetical protein
MFQQWGWLKTTGYETCPATILNLEQWSWQCIEAIPNDKLQHVMASLPCQMQECRRGDGGYLKSHFQMLFVIINFPLSQ